MLLAALLLSSTSDAAEPKIREVAVTGTRVHVGDLTPGLSPEAAGIELGPAPSAGGSRIVDRAEIADALRQHGLPAPSSLPAAVRVTRRAVKLNAAAIERLVREALPPKLSRGVTLEAVHLARVVDVPDGYTTVEVSLPKTPHRSGHLSSAVSVSFRDHEQETCVVSVPVELALSQEATIYDVPRGGHLTLVIRRGLVEVSTGVTAAAAADIGGIVPVVISPSGKIISARVEDSDHAVAVDAQ